MTVHLLAGAGSYSGTEWKPTGRRKISTAGTETSRAACGALRPHADITTEERTVTCGSCKRAVEFGTNYRDGFQREQARRRARALRLAARNRALRQLVEAHADEFLRRFDDEHVLLVLSVRANEYPPDEELPPPPAAR